MKSYIQKLRSKCISWLPIQFRERPIANNEKITRFIFAKDFIQKNKIRHAAFIDSRSPGELSVFRISSYIKRNKQDDIWALGKLIQNRTIKGRGDLKASTVTELKENQEPAGLLIVSDPVFHRLHANIRNLPIDEARQQSIAQILANNAELLRPIT
jgi:hypothetical protein